MGNIAEAAKRRRGNILRLSCALIEAVKTSVSIAAINDVGISGVRRNVSGFARTDGVPVGKSNGAVVTATGRGDRAAILLRAIDAVRKLVVHGHVIELRSRLVIPGTPGLAAIHADAGALVATENHALRVRRINPKGVVIVAAGSALDGLKLFAAIA